MPEQFDIRKEEYLALRKEIENDLKELSDLERNCVISTATAYAWIVTTSALHAQLAPVAWMLPLILPMYGAARAYSIGNHLSLVGGYLRTIEIKLYPLQPNASQDGWEHYFDEHGRSITTRIRYGFWIGFFLLVFGCSLVGAKIAWGAMAVKLCELPSM